MKLFTDLRLPTLLTVLALALGAWQIEATSTRDQAAEASAWLHAHAQLGPPGADELAELKAANPDAYAMVKALLMKKSMGLIKTPDHHAAPLGIMPLSADMPEKVGSNMPSLEEPSPLMDGLRPPSVPLNNVSQMPGLGGPPAPELANSGQAPPAEAPELWTLRPTAPPEMPPPPPIPGDGPPELEDLPPPAPMMSPEELTSSMKIKVPAGFKESLPHLSAASVATMNSGGSHHNWLNWNPDQVIAENEKMVNNLLSTVAQLTGAHVSSHHTEPTDMEPALSEEPQQVLSQPVPSQPMPPPAASQWQPPVLRAAATETMAMAPNVQVQNDPQEVGTFPSSISWGNPYGSSSANARSVQPRRENQFLKGIDFGVPQVQAPPRRSSDDSNPYLTGLNFDGASPKASEVKLDPSTLNAFHKSQLLSSHKLLSSHENDLGDETAPQRQRPQRRVRSSPKHISAVGTGSAATSDQNNPYLVGLGDDEDAGTPDPPAVEAAGSGTLNLRGVKQHQGSQENRFPLASFKWDDNEPQHQLSMTSSTVQQKKSAVASQARSQKKNALGGWLKVAQPPQGPSPRVQRLRQTIQQKVSDDNNPYLKGLDLEAPQPDAVRPEQTPDNPYLNRMG